MEIKERFIEMCTVDTTTEECLELKHVYGQGYDGAANMSGMYKGLQARIRAHNEKALYVHCKAHCLNLVLRHAALVRCQQSLYPGQRVLELQQLWDTRWACREAALKALQRNLNAVLKLLDDIIDIDPPDLARGDAQMYRHAINFLFLLCLEIATPVFKVTAVASDPLQEEGLDHSTAYKVIDGVLRTLQTMTSEESFGEIFKCASEKAESLDIEVPTEVPETDIQIKHSEVIRIFKDMAPRRMLL
ncbi:hypothetical protein KUCAC02_021587 [Chaenocephalus aceratus]|uniref:Uncharacterized protein n=1 Tax=Chaenocephalus aceratus TaxID=36190 RepID=A0ACB9XH67_CHAAC|nr:hypothetical protein KUCAC02_021587 [Chaenocephalus aceratus]